MSESKKQLICPIMSCRVTTMDLNSKVLTPTIIRCQEGDCGWWDDGNKACSVKSMVIELVGVNG